MKTVKYTNIIDFSFSDKKQKIQMIKYLQIFRKVRQYFSYLTGKNSSEKFLFSRHQKVTKIFKVFREDFWKRSFTEIFLD